ncbi:hypothetical protein ACIF9R_03970, partial [Streptomyces sp. NPDC086080]
AARGTGLEPGGAEEPAPEGTDVAAEDPAADAVAGRAGEFVPGRADEPTGGPVDAPYERLAETTMELFIPAQPSGADAPTSPTPAGHPEPARDHGTDTGSDAGPGSTGRPETEAVRPGTGHDGRPVPGNAPGAGPVRSGTDAPGAGERPEAGAVQPDSDRVFGAEPAAGTVRLPDADVSGPQAGTTRPGTGPGPGSPVPGADAFGAGERSEAQDVHPGGGRESGASSGLPLRPGADEAEHARVADGGADGGADDEPVTDKGLPKRTPKISAPAAPPRPRGGAVDAEALRRRLGGFRQGADAGRRDVEAEIAERGDAGRDQAPSGTTPPSEEPTGGTVEEASR